MGEWKEYKLQDVVSKLGDGLHGTPQYDNRGDHFFINGNNLVDGKIVIKENTQRVSYTEYLKYKKELNDRTILLGINGTIGNVALYNNEKCILGKSACYFNVKSEVDKHFIKYVVTNKHFQDYIETFAHGTTIMNVSLQTVREYTFKLPPLPEQKSIASILSSLDDKIDLLHRQNKTLEALAETLFRQWFIEAAPQPSPNLSHGEREKREEAEDGWETGKLGDYVQFVKGKKPKEAAEEYSIGLAPQILIETFDTGKTLFSEPQNMIIADEIDILMVMDGASSGRVEIGFAGIVGSTIGLFKPISTFNYPLFIFYLLKARESHIREHTTGSAIPHADKALILNLDIQYPSIERVIEFENMAEIWFEKKKANRNQIRTLTRLRDTLLPKLMSGEVRVEL